ncbi:hypothetical protein EON65_21865, partial [archaeon]
MSFIGSSSLWGDQAVARLCEIVMESNDGLAQQVVENRTDLLDLCSKAELERTDDLGLTLPFLAVYYDQADILRYLHRRGLDLSNPCDPMAFGSPLFYAIALKRSNLISVLYKLGYKVSKSCDSMFNRLPLDYARRYDDQDTITILNTILQRENAANTLLRNFIQAKKQRKRFLRYKKAIMHVQRVVRGFLDRRYVRALKKGEVGG